MEETGVKNKISDLDEFSKLFKINIPINKHFYYYLNTLVKSKEYAHLYTLIDDFVALEAFSKFEGYSSAKSYKLDYAFPKLVKYIEESNVYDVIQNYQFPENKHLVTKDDFKRTASQNYWYISFDISKANYSSFKLLDDKNEMMGSWEELCNHLDIHPTLIKSKSFRQVVFGNTNPKRLQKLQHIQVTSAIEYLRLKGISEENICFISHDEFVLRFKQDDPNDVWLTNQYSKKEMLAELSAQMSNVPLKSTIYELDKVSKDIFLKTVHTSTDAGKIPAYKTLVGAPGNKYYKYFKLYVLKEELEERDLFFMNDGEVAKWMSDEDSIETSFAPEGELSLDQVKADYGYFYDQLSKEFPFMSEAQKRKVINISTSLCRSCMNSDNNCVCHKDE